MLTLLHIPNSLFWMLVSSLPSKKLKNVTLLTCFWHWLRATAMRVDDSSLNELLSLLLLFEILMDSVEKLSIWLMIIWRMVSLYCAN